jgi:hypothetical protein
LLRHACGLTLLALAGSAGGCAGMQALGGDDSSVQVHGDQNSVTVDTRWDGLDPYPAAERHCAGFGRTAKFRETNPHRTIFDCVAEPPARGD